MGVRTQATFKNLILRVQTEGYSEGSSGLECGSVPSGAYAAQQWSHWTVLLHKPPPSKIKSLYGHDITHSVGSVTSSAVLSCGGISPAATTLRSLIRKLKVAHAFGCKDEAKYRWVQLIYREYVHIFHICLLCSRRIYTLLQRNIRV